MLDSTDHAFADTSVDRIPISWTWIAKFFTFFTIYAFVTNAIVKVIVLKACLTALALVTFSAHCVVIRMADLPGMGFVRVRSKFAENTYSPEIGVHRRDTVSSCQGPRRSSAFQPDERRLAELARLRGAARAARTPGLLLRYVCTCRTIRVHDLTVFYGYVGFGMCNDFLECVWDTGITSCAFLNQLLLRSNTVLGQIGVQIQSRPLRIRQLLPFWHCFSPLLSDQISRPLPTARVPRIPRKHDKRVPVVIFRRQHLKVISFLIQRFLRVLVFQDDVENLIRVLCRTQLMDSGEVQVETVHVEAAFELRQLDAPWRGTLQDKEARHLLVVIRPFFVGLLFVDPTVRAKDVAQRN